MNVKAVCIFFPSLCTCICFKCSIRSLRIDVINLSALFSVFYVHVFVWSLPVCMCLCAGLYEHTMREGKKSLTSMAIWNCLYRNCVASLFEFVMHAYLNVCHDLNPQIGNLGAQKPAAHNGVPMASMYWGVCLHTEIPTIIDPGATKNYPSATGSIIVGISVLISVSTSQVMCLSIHKCVCFIKKWFFGGLAYSLYTYYCLLTNVLVWWELICFFAQYALCQGI
jgi:hypothetical protein